MILMVGGASLAAQGRGAFTVSTAGVELRTIDSFENVPAITGAPFTAEATTEFVQMLADGNRIEQRYSTSVARDGRGRTRREQQVALVGPFSVLQGSDKLFTLRTGVNWQGSAAQVETPRLVIISDPVDGVSPCGGTTCCAAPDGGARLRRVDESTAAGHSTGRRPSRACCAW